MNVLLLGSGGREHAFASLISRSPLLTQLYIAPGNAGTDEQGTNVNLGVNDFEQIGSFCSANAIDMIVVGPEAPLVKGIVNHFKGQESLHHIKVVGPDKIAAQLEGSKAFAKEFMMRHGIPTAGYIEVSPSTLEEGIRHIRSSTPPVVLKADGLAAGKGVLIINDHEEAVNELKSMLDGKFGAASEKVVIEEFLDGIEFSVFVITDGKTYKTLPVAKDYKRIGEGDQGLNTGGMGAVSPVNFVDSILWEKVERQVIEPTMEGIRKDKLDYKGFIFFGLINVNGDPFVIEYNCRMGDPETEVVFPRLNSDLLKMMDSLFDGSLQDQQVEIDPRYATAIMLVSGGYPEAYQKGKTIHRISEVKDSTVFQAGTLRENGNILTNGGRVIAICSMDHDMNAALAKSRKNAEIIDFEGKYYRSDIGFDL